MPMLWRDDAIGWINLAVTAGRLEFNVGSTGAIPAGRDFRREFDAELDRMRAFLSHEQER